jgi:hypothetical protein
MTQTASSKWYSRGADGVEKERKRLEALDKPNRLWIPRGKENRVVILDEESFNIYEYNWQMGGSWLNWATMPEDPEANEVFREKGLKPYFVAMRTIINCTPYTDRNGKEHNFQFQLLPAKKKTAQLLEERSKDHDGIAGKMFKVRRFEDDKSISAGDDWVFEKEVELDKLLEYAEYKGKKLLDLIKAANESEEKAAYLKSKFAVNVTDGTIVPGLTPFNYFEILGPPSKRQARDLVAGYSGGSGRGSSNGAKEDTDVPF